MQNIFNMKKAHNNDQKDHTKEPHKFAILALLLKDTILITDPFRVLRLSRLPT